MKLRIIIVLYIVLINHSSWSLKNVGMLVMPGDLETSVHGTLLSSLTSHNFTTIQIRSSSSLETRKGICNLLQRGVIGLFSTSQSPLLTSTAGVFDIPHCLHGPRWDLKVIDYSGDPYNPQPTTTSSGNSAGSVYTIGMTRGHWKSFLSDVVTFFEPDESIALLYENRESLWRLQTLLEAPSPISQQVYLRSLEDPLAALRHIRERVRTIILDASISIIRDVLRLIVQLEMKDHHIILTNLDAHTLDLSEFYSTNLTSFRILSPGNEHLLTEEALAIDCVDAFTQGLQSLPGDIKAEVLSCDEMVPWSAGLTLFNYISSVDFHGKTGRISFREGIRSHIDLTILRLGSKSHIPVGTWSSTSGVEISNPKSFYDIGLRNTTLSVVTVLEIPYVQIRPNQSGNARFEGFSVDLLRLIANQVGFKYSIEQESKYGVMDPEDGEWNGVVRKLVDRKADLAIGSMTINHARESVIDFTKPFMHLGIAILFKVPDRPEAKLFSFLNPLAPEIWLAILFSYVCVSITLYVVARFSPMESPHFGLANAFWYPVGTLMQQGSDLNPRATSTRLVGGFWWFFSLVIVSSYTANLAAFLTVERMSTPIESAEDLADQSEIAYGTLDSGSTMAFFRDSKMETYQRMWRFMESRKPSVFVSTYEEGIQRVLDGNYAFLMESSMLDFVVQQNCNLTQIGTLLDSKGYGIALPIGSPWRDKISLAILEMTEKGIIQSLKNKWWRSTSSTGCSSEDLRKKKEASALGVDSIGGVFVVLILGLSVAVVVAIFEFCVHAKQSSASLCSEMAREARFAVRCHGTRRRPALTRHCANCCENREEVIVRRVYHDYHTYPHEHRHFSSNNGGI